jgi:hypothetical protein
LEPHKNYETRLMTWSMLHTEDPQILGTTIKYLIAMTTLCPGFVYPCKTPYFWMLFFASVILPHTPYKPMLYTVRKWAIGFETGATQLPQMLVTEPVSWWSEMVSNETEIDLHCIDHGNDNKASAWFRLFCIGNVRYKCFIYTHFN